jgi:UrcA family protein
MLPSRKIQLRVIPLLMVSALLVAQSAIAAARVDDVPSVTVQYRDLNLNNREGIATLYTRIHTAALEVCKAEDGPQYLHRVFWNACVAHAMASAVQTVHNDKLSAYHSERIRDWQSR